MAKGKVRHWKHGWIPVSPEAKAYVEGRGPKPTGTRRGLHPVKTPGSPLGTKVALDLDTGTYLDRMKVIRRVKPDPGREVMYSPEAENAAKRIRKRYRALEPSVTPKLVSLAARNGGYMQGLKYKLKDQESLARKLDTKSKTKGLTVLQYEPKIGDALRYTQISNTPENYADASQKTIDALRAAGNKVTVENTWTPGSSYKGINTNVTDAAGNTYELQFHTADSFDVKMKQHDLYEIERDPKKPLAERQAATAEMAANMATLVDPPGAASVH